MSNPEVAGPPSGEVTLSPNPGKPAAGLAIAALIVGIVAFLSGLAPVFGFIAGTTAAALGVIALAKRQSKGLALTGIILGALGALTSLVMTVALIAGVASTSDPETESAPAAVSTNSPSATPSDVPEPEQSEEPAAVTETVSQTNAKRAAQGYLEFMAFSRSGLIGQLEYEGYSTEDATYGVDAIGADWSEQAAKSAESYLEMMAFSRSGLIDQLIYEGYTQEEAEFGVTAVGL